MPSTENHVVIPQNPTQKSIVKHDYLSLSVGTIWKIKSGYCYTRTVSSVGDYQLLGVWKPGDILTNPDLFVYEIKAISNTVIEEVKSSQDLSEGLLVTFKRSQQLLQIIKTKTMEAKVIEFLRWLAENFGNHTDSHMVKPDFRLTHEEMATALNSTRVTITRTLQDLEQQGVVKIGKRQEGIAIVSGS